MAVMTSSAFDKIPLDPKATSFPLADAMALDTETNGVHDVVLDRPDSHVPEDPAQPQPTVNGNHISSDTSAPAVEPTTNVSSGIEGVAQYLPDSQTDNNSLFGGSETGVPSIANAVEAPTSDMHDEAGPDTTTQYADASATNQASSEGTQKVPETQLASREERSGGPVQTDAMEISQAALDSTAPPTNSMTELSIQTQQTSAPSSQPPLTQSSENRDQEMEDAPASGKVRPREDDDEEAREAKRAKTEEEMAGQAEFKVPELPTHTEHANGGASATVPTQEPSSVQEAATYEEWPSAPVTPVQQKFLLERIRNTKKIKVSGAFKEPVDPVALNIPQYFDHVKHPMDLSTMESKLKDGNYTYVREFMEDLDLIINNSVVFNGKDHPVTQAGYNMRAYFLKGMGKMPREGAEEPPKQAKAKKPSVPTAPKPRRESRTASTTAKSPTAPTPTAPSPQSAWPLNADGLPLIRRDSSSANDRPKREIHRPPSKDLPYTTAKPRKKKYQQELKFCESVIAEIMKPKYSKFSYPFLSPVDPVALNIPSYLKIIKKPMDFGTIEKNLKGGAYQSAKDFYNDAQLVFNNCYKFNPEGDEVHKMGKQLHELFNNLWSEKADWLAQHAPEAEPQSPGSAYSDEEEEEEEEEEDPAQAQFLAIQKQIAALNETAQQLLQQQKGKRTSPKASGKKKSKPAPQPKKKHTPLSVPPPAKTGRSKPRVNLEPHTGDWEDVGGGFNYTEDFGWESDGLRGHIFADTMNSTVVIGLKGTSPAMFDGSETTTNDKENDNLFFSCCCGQGGQFLWRQVCDCQTSTYRCNSTCLVEALWAKNRYYYAARDLYHNVTALYPGAEVWMAGHSLGGAVSSFLSLTYGHPAVTFEAVPEAMPASRLGLPVPPGHQVGALQQRKMTGGFHFGHTADPVYMGTCNKASSICTFGGYAMQSVCHTGKKCVYDTVKDFGWRVGIGTHKIVSVIKEVLEKYDEPAACEQYVNCTDCYPWEFFESNGTESTTSSTIATSTSTSTRTRTETCKTPGWWGCLDESTTDQATKTTITTTTTTRSASSTSTCKTPGWFGCKDEVTMTPTTATPPPVPAPTTATPSSLPTSRSSTSSCKHPGWFGGCNDPTDPPSTSSTPSPTSASSTSCTSKGWFGLICYAGSKTSTESPVTERMEM